MNNKALLRARVDKLLADKKVETVTDIVPYGDPLYQKVYRQLFNNKDSDITFDVLNAILVKFEDVSAEWLIRGEGLDTRAKVVIPPPAHHQEIHIDGGQAAISQSGTATIDAPKEPTASEPDIATMINNNDLGGLVAIIMKQKDEILRLTNQRLEDLERYARIADSQLFPPVK